MWDILNSIVDNTELYQKWMKKHLIHKLHHKRILVVMSLAFPEEKSRIQYSFSIGLVKGNKNEKYQINIILKEDGDVIHSQFIYLYSDLPLEKPGHLDAHLDRFVYTYPGLTAEFDQLMKELKEDIDPDGQDYKDPSKLN